VSLDAAQRRLAVEREQLTCVHFNGVQHGRCRAGVPYDSVRADARPGLRNFPCFGAAELPCQNRSLPSLEEAERIVDEREAAVAVALARIANGVCIECGVESTDWKQAGHCIYAMPCGHRVGQGNAKEFADSVRKNRIKGKEPQP